MLTSQRPAYIRETPTFYDLFGVSAATVLTAMDAAGDDIPNAFPAVRLAIDSVGMTRRDVLVSIHDPFGSDEIVTAICELRLSASVPATRRGLHLSRIGSAVAERGFATYADLPDYAAALAGAIAALEYGEAEVTVDARVPYVEALATGRTSPKLSLEHLNVLVRAAVRDGRTIIDSGIRVDHIVACPCVQQMLKHTQRQRAGTPGAGNGFGLPLITHSQRCTTAVTVCETNRHVRAADLLRALDATLIRTCSTLPRDFELACVYRAHRAPQFIEDALRSAVVAINDMLRPPAVWAAVHGTARSLESIHDFDLTAEMTMRAGDGPHDG